MEESLLLFQKNVAELLNISMPQFYNIIKTPGFPKPARIDGGRAMYRRKDIVNWVDSLFVEPAKVADGYQISEE